ncbi:MAG: hypothetical protein Kow0059_19950 [Candidatus Sumerlaeia bacterium]
MLTLEHQSLPRSAGPNVRRSLCLLFDTAALAGLAFQLAKYLDSAFSAWGVDYIKHYDAVIKMLDGRNPYAGRFFDAYPALTKPLFVWLALFDPYMGEVMWDVWNALMILGAAALAGWAWRPDPPRTALPLAGPLQRSTLMDFKDFLARRWWAWGAALVGLYQPALSLLHAGNIAPTNFFLLVLWGAFLVRRRPFATGFMLVVAAMVKIFTIIALLPFVLGGRRRVLAGAAAALGLYGLGLSLAGWWGYEWGLYSTVLPALPFRFQGISYGLNNLIVAWAVPSAGTSEPTFRALSAGVGAAVLGATALILWLARHRLLHDGEDFDDALTLTLVALPLITPLLEYHHYVWCAVAWLLLWRRWASGTLPDSRFFPQLLFWLLILAGGIAGDMARGGYWTALPGAMGLWALNAWYLMARNTETPHCAQAEMSRMGCAP